MNTPLLFLDAIKPAGILVIIGVALIPLIIAFVLGYYMGKDSAWKEIDKELKNK